MFSILLKGVLVLGSTLNPTSNAFPYRISRLFSIFSSRQFLRCFFSVRVPCSACYLRTLFCVSRQCSRVLCICCTSSQLYCSCQILNSWCPAPRSRQNRNFCPQRNHCRHSCVFPFVELSLARVCVCRPFASPSFVIFPISFSTSFLLRRFSTPPQKRGVVVFSTCCIHLYPTVVFYFCSLTTVRVSSKP